jgi:hypothetical protein
MNSTPQLILSENSIVTVYGYRFRATKVWKSHFPTRGGVDVYYFTGQALDSSLINTGYNGATYSWRTGEPFEPFHPCL